MQKGNFPKYFLCSEINSKFEFSGEEIFLIWQNWGFSSMETVSADHSMVVRLDPVTYKFMEGRGDLVSGLAQIDD